MYTYQQGVLISGDSGEKGHKYYNELRIPHFTFDLIGIWDTKGQKGYTKSEMFFVLFVSAMQMSDHSDKVVLWAVHMHMRLNRAANQNEG